MYDGVTGELTTIGVEWRYGAQDSVLFQWDELGRRDTLVYTNAIVVGFAYDADGRFRRLCSTHGGAASPNVFKIRVQHEWVDPDGLVRQLSTASDGDCTSNATLIYVHENEYDIRHQLVTQDESGSGQVIDYEYDASGNMTMRQMTPGLTHNYIHDSGHNRLVKDDYGTDPDDYVLYDYDDDGSQREQFNFVDGDATISIP